MPILPQNGYKQTNPPMENHEKLVIPVIAIIVVNC